VDLPVAYVGNGERVVAAVGHQVNVATGRAQVGKTDVGAGVDAGGPRQRGGAGEREGIRVARGIWRQRIAAGGAAAIHINAFRSGKVDDGVRRRSTAPHGGHARVAAGARRDRIRIIAGRGAGQYERVAAARLTAIDVDSQGAIVAADDADAVVATQQSETNRV